MRTFLYCPILLLSLLATLTPLRAQQISHFNQSTWNPRLFNPASQGGKSGGEVAIAYRTQFLELEADDRPTSYLLHADLSPLAGERVGLAVQLLNDKVSLLNRLQFTGFFGYHLLNTDNIRFSLGAMAGATNQKLDFDGVRTAQAVDLLVFNSEANSTSFDGGPGLAFEYRTTDGSFFALDAAAPGLFNNKDIAIQSSNPDLADEALYDVIPHILANARVRYQGAGFAIEPNLMFRALSGERPLKAGKMDVNLNAYFLENNMLMIGAGMRTNGAGFHFQAGVTLIDKLRVTLAAESHSMLGLSYEMGLAYTFGKPDPVIRDDSPKPIKDVTDTTTKKDDKPINKNTKPDKKDDKPAKTFAEKAKNLYENTRQTTTNLNPQFASIRNRQSATTNVIKAGGSISNRNQKLKEAERCANMLEESAKEIEAASQKLQALETERQSAKSMAKTIEGQGKKISKKDQDNLTAADNLYNIAKRNLDELTLTQTKLVQDCNNLKPNISEKDCIREGDTECVKELFGNKLNAANGKPANLFPLQLTLAGSQAIATYQFPDDEETYELPAGVRALADHIVAQVEDLNKQGISFDGLELVTVFQDDKSTIEYKPGYTYGGEFNNTFSIPDYTLSDNSGKNKTETKKPTVKRGDKISQETLGALKVTALQKYLVGKGIAANKIALKLQYNNPGNSYREETKIVLKVRG
ncbi:MAG: PorP/SprF family type IX secretion system membrane protein [Saprospiraceae bacterium]|nr:PorP/SprF family type IX secretion system membrane protein [Saprospiraceae bacterium]